MDGGGFGWGHAAAAGPVVRRGSAPLAGHARRRLARCVRPFLKRRDRRRSHRHGDSFSSPRGFLPVRLFTAVSRDTPAPASLPVYSPRDSVSDARSSRDSVSEFSRGFFFFLSFYIFFRFSRRGLVRVPSVFS